MASLLDYKGNETILVVDDEFMIRDFLTCLLEDLGYKVMISEDGEDAVNRYKQHHDSIKAVIMDVMMPKKDGITAYWEIKEIKADANILLVSGFDNSTFPHKFTNLPIIPKPFKPEEIVKKIRTTIDGTA